MTCSGLGFFCYRSLQSYLQERDESIREEVRHDELEPQLRDYQRHVDVLLSDQKYLQERLQKAEVTKANIADSSEASESLREQLEKLQVALKEKTRDMATSVQQLEEKLQLQTSYRQRYAQGIQELSREALMDQFGPGPYHVQLEVALQDGDKKKPSSILLELAAAADDVPHTVYTFLRRVAAGLYDGSAFYQKTEHLLAAGAVKVDGTSVKDRFVEAGLDHLYLQEYSEAWPHVPWTVGLAGRPAGTEFYINLLDNQVPHGPGGQTNHADPSQADPCFAKVTKGVEVIQHVEKQVGNVEIVQARILTQKEGEKETRKKKK
jgi:cyclophilin family peptidyl-prolyl cis-trans isomerase